MEAGLQFHLPTHSRLPITDMLELGRMAADGGINQIWVTDNLGNRDVFVVLASLATNLPLRLGTAIMVQYFRNPIVAADCIATVTELTDGELSIGIGRGNIRTPESIDVFKPVSMMRETAIFLRRMLDGEEVRSADFPVVSQYFNLAPDKTFVLNFVPTSRPLLFCGGDGPKSLNIGGRFMDGLLLGTTFSAIMKMGYLDQRLEAFDAAARSEGKSSPRRCVAEFKIALSEDPEESRNMARKSVAMRVLGLRWRGFSNDDLRTLGIEPADVDRIEAAREERGGVASPGLADLVTDPMIDAFYIAGDLTHCRETVEEIRELTEEKGIEQLMFSGVAPDFKEGLRLLNEHIIPVVV